MLWYVAIVAALNLGLGYLWAVFTRRCPRCARRRATAELMSTAPTSGRQGAAPSPVVATAAAADHPPGDAASTVNKTAATGAEGTIDANAIDWSKMFDRYFGGLNAYRGELNEVTQQLDGREDDVEHVTQCATRLRAANDTYIGVANDTIGQLDKEPLQSPEREAGQTKFRQSVSGQLNVAATSKAELDQLDIAAEPAAARASLKKTTEQLHGSTDGLMEEVQECLASMRAEFETADAEPKPTPVPRDPGTGLVTREHAEHLIGQLADTVQADNPVTVALLELDETDSATAGAVDPRLLSGISNVLRQSLTADHTAARFSERQFLIVVPREDVNQAARRTEEMRQRVASAEFVAEGRPMKATVTCALAEISAERSGQKLFEFLAEALAEAKRYGGNRTFTHDGNSPTPVVPPELALAAQQLAI